MTAAAGKQKYNKVDIIVFWGLVLLYLYFYVYALQTAVCSFFLFYFAFVLSVFRFLGLRLRLSYRQTLLKSLLDQYIPYL